MIGGITYRNIIIYLPYLYFFFAFPLYYLQVEIKVIQSSVARDYFHSPVAFLKSHSRLPLYLPISPFFYFYPHTIYYMFFIPLSFSCLLHGFINGFIYFYVSIFLSQWHSGRNSSRNTLFNTVYSAMHLLIKSLQSKFFVLPSQHTSLSLYKFVSVNKN